MKKKISIRVISLIVASVMLSGAVAFAAVTGSPYETLKKALLNAALYTNATVETHTVMKFNGEVVEETRSINVNAENGYLNHYFDGSGDDGYFDFGANGLSLSSYVRYESEDGTQWYHASVSPPNTYYVHGAGFAGVTQDDLNSARIRFFELLVDLMVGDLKNNITMSTSNGIRTIQGTLTGSQVPEIVRAGIDILVEESGSYYRRRNDIGFDGSNYTYEIISINGNVKTVNTYSMPARIMTPEEELSWHDGTFWETDREWWGIEYGEDGTMYITAGYDIMINEYTAPVERSDFDGNSPFDIPMKNLSINFVRGEAEVDSNGNLLSLGVSGSFALTDIFGEINEVELDSFISFTDIGTSVAVSPIPGAAQLLTSEYIKTRFDTQYAGVYFSLNEDGTINEDSITTAFPGELEGDIDAAKLQFNYSTTGIRPPLPAEEYNAEGYNIVITDPFEKGEDYDAGQ